MLASCRSPHSLLPVLPSLDDPEIEDGLSWIQVLPDGRVRFFCPRMEMGQGASLGLCQIVAEEMNVDQPDIECVTPSTNQTKPFKMTVGSEGIANFFAPVSHGAAQLRETLRSLASEQLTLPLSQINDARGGFILPDGEQLPYRMIVPGDAQILHANIGATQDNLPARSAERRSNKYSAIGKEWKHHDLHKIVTGQCIFSRDMSLPDMLYGEAVHPPAFGARLVTVNADKVKAIPGVKKVIVDWKDGFCAIVADNPFTLSTAIAALDTDWHVPDSLNQSDLDRIFDVQRANADSQFEHELMSTGDLAKGRRRAHHRLTSRYDTPFAVHAPMEPRAAVADVKPEKVELWCGSQDPFFVQRQVAQQLGCKPEKIIVHALRMGGGFGGRVQCLASIEAARLSAAVGQPVAVQWHREMELRDNYFQPAFSHLIDAGVNTNGTISHWHHKFVSSPIVTGLVPDSISWFVDRVVADEGTARGSKPRYAIKNCRIDYSDIRTSIPTGAWRGLGAAPNTFAIESMIDELAHAARIDPMQFRLQNISDEEHRLAAVLREVANISNWDNPLPADMGRGVACAVYKGLTAVAVVVEVAIDHAEERIQVTRAWCAQDCGLVINPDQVKSQITGNIVWGCSMTLKERVTIEAGRIVEDNFDSYEILRNHECPDVTIALVDPESSPPSGVGEAAFPPVAPAIANAIFAATTQRVRQLPVSYHTLSSSAGRN